jgi:hypothetical protein
VELATPLSLDGDWHLVSHASVVRVAAASTEARDKCDVSIVHYDVTPKVVDAARAGITGQLPTIDRKVRGVDLSNQVAEWWRLLRTPIRLAEGVWLLLGPEQLSVGPVSGQNKIITVPVSLGARPRIVTSAVEPVVAATVLPHLGHDSTSDGYHIALDGVLDYATASRELTTALSTKSFSQAGRTVTLGSANIRPLAKGRLSLALAIGGDLHGTVQLVGTPRVDHVADVITVPDLDFDLHTDDKLVQAYSSIRSDALRDELRQRARIPLAPVLARGRALLLEGLNRKIGDAVTLSGTVEGVGARDLFVTRDGLVVRAEAVGHAGMSVKQR